METPDPKYKHKPSEKHTLEEVLKSLQDLIRNDLTEGASGTAKPVPAPAESRRREGTAKGSTEVQPSRENTANLREDFAPVSPGSGPVNLDAVMRSLKDLIGNELNVGDEPKPPDANSTAAHEEYLAAEEKIEEYIPEELGRLDDELNIGDVQFLEQPEATPPRDQSPAPVEIIEESLPEGFIPPDEELTLEELAEAAPLPPAVPEPDFASEISPELLGEPAPTTPPDQSPASEAAIEAIAPEEFTPPDEELTLEQLAEVAPPSPAMPKTMKLPGESWPEMLGEPEATTPAVPETPVAIKENIAPGTQHEMFFEEPPIPSKRSETAPTDSVSVSAPEPEPASQVTQKPVAEKPQSPDEKTALPTIDVEENFDDSGYFVEALVEGAPQPAPAETLPGDAGAPSEQEIIAPPVEETTTSPEAADQPETAGPAKEKIKLELADEPAVDKPQYEHAVDFDSSDLSPPLPEEPELSPNAAGAASEPAPGKPRDEFSIDFDVSDLSPPPSAEPEPPPPETGTATGSETSSKTAKAGDLPAQEKKASVTLEEPPATLTKAKKTPKAKQPAASKEPAAPSAPKSLNLDDIPVLNEVVAPPAGSVPAAKPVAPPPTLPAPDRSRDIVVRAVAKLNVEMRKSGGAGLDTKTILRLQQLIRQELEKNGEK